MKKLLFTLAIVAMAFCSEAQFVNSNTTSSADIMYHQRNSAVPEAIIRAFDNGTTKYARLRMGRAGGLHGASIGNIGSGGNETLGQIIFQGFYNSWMNAALIQGETDGTVGTTAMPGRLIFKTTPASSVVLEERMRITKEGYVGIGTASPTVLLDCDGDAIFNESSGDNDFRVEGNGNSALLFVDAGNDRVQINSLDNTVAPGYALDVMEDRGNSWAANIFNDGNNQTRYGLRIQCGEDTPSMDVYPISFYDGNGTALGSIIYDYSGGSMAFGSDRKLKTNIKDSEQKSLDIINGLRVVDFNWKDRWLGKTATGFIAQEAQEVFPQMVHKAPNEDFLMISPSTLIPVLVKGMQEQQQMIEEAMQTSKDKVLQKEVEDLRAELDELKDLVAGRKTTVTIENPQGIILNQNDPNPFREMTTIGYVVPENVSSASIIIYDLNGRLIKEVNVQAGAGQLEIYASDLSSGTYTYSIIADGKVIDSKKMMVSK